jgi:hypothetical protein
MKFIALPSGKIINLDQVAFVNAAGIFGDEQAKDAKLNVCFSAMAVGQHGGGALHLALKGDDITAFLSVMAEAGLKTDATLAATLKKMN